MTARFLVGDVFEQLATLEDGSVDLVLSSPPFLALRSYLPADHVDKGKEIGSESTPGEFLDTILDVVEECARVMTPHGSLVFEFGDTYHGARGYGSEYGNEGAYGERSAERWREARVDKSFAKKDDPDWPMSKSLCMIPESFAWALAYGRNPFTGRETEPWRVRNFCPWVRPNPPVGALGDKFRPGTSYLTVACKARDRWFDLDAVRVPYAENTINNGKVMREGIAGNGPKSKHDNGGHLPERKLTHAGAPPLDWFNIPTQPYAGSHYATWPSKLVLPFVMSMCPPGGTVLDPFAGSGTTLAVATGCGRNAIGIDLDSRNLELARARIGMFLVEEEPPRPVEDVVGL